MFIFTISSSSQKSHSTTDKEPRTSRGRNYIRGYNRSCGKLGGTARGCIALAYKRSSTQGEGEYIVRSYIPIQDDIQPYCILGKADLAYRRFSQSTKAHDRIPGGITTGLIAPQRLRTFFLTKDLSPVDSLSYWRKTPQEPTLLGVPFFLRRRTYLARTERRTPQHALLPQVVTMTVLVQPSGRSVYVTCPFMSAGLSSEIT